jgi:hypothetical protein
MQPGKMDGDGYTFIGCVPSRFSDEFRAAVKCILGEDAEFSSYSPAPHRYSRESVKLGDSSPSFLGDDRPSFFEFMPQLIDLLPEWEEWQKQAPG